MHSECTYELQIGFTTVIEHDECSCGMVSKCGTTLLFLLFACHSVIRNRRIVFHVYLGDTLGCFSPMGKAKSSSRSFGFRASREKRTYEAKKEDWLVVDDYRPIVVALCSAHM